MIEVSNCSTCGWATQPKAFSSVTIWCHHWEKQKLTDSIACPDAIDSWREFPLGEAEIGIGRLKDGKPVRSVGVPETKGETDD